MKNLIIALTLIALTPTLAIMIATDKGPFERYAASKSATPVLMANLGGAK